MAHPTTPRSDSATTFDAPASTAASDRIGTGAGLAIVGFGLVCFAGVEMARLYLDHTQPPLQAALATTASTPTPQAVDSPMCTSGEDCPEDRPFQIDWPTSADPMGAQQAVGTGPGAPGKSTRLPAATGQIVGIAANPIPNGTCVFRVWSTGRIEAMITTEDNTWGPWVPVAPGLSTDMKRPRAPEDPNNPE